MLRRVLTIAVVVVLASPLAAALPVSPEPVVERMTSALTILLLVGWWAWPPGILLYSALLPRFVARRRVRSPRTTAVLTAPLIAVVPLALLAAIAALGSPSDGTDGGLYLLTVSLLPALAAGALVPLGPRRPTPP